MVQDEDSSVDARELLWQHGSGEVAHAAVAGVRLIG
jgi:hypothetical protein